MKQIPCYYALLREVRGRQYLLLNCRYIVLNEINARHAGHGKYIRITQRHCFVCRCPRWPKTEKKRAITKRL